MFTTWLDKVLQVIPPYPVRLQHSVDKMGRVGSLWVIFGYLGKGLGHNFPLQHFISFLFSYSDCRCHLEPVGRLSPGFKMGCRDWIQPSTICQLRLTIAMFYFLVPNLVMTHEHIPYIIYIVCLKNRKYSLIKSVSSMFLFLITSLTFVLLFTFLSVFWANQPP